MSETSSIYFLSGLTAFEAATFFEMRKNGDEWHLFRSAAFRNVFGNVSHSLRPPTIDLILQMTTETPSERPLAPQIVQLLKNEEVATLKRQIQYERNASDLLRR